MIRSPLNRPSDLTTRHLLIAASTAVFLGAVDLSVIATVLPDIVVDLGINTADIDRFIWVVTGYLIAYVAAIPFAGMLADSIGRRRTLALALVTFAAGSIVCATAESLQHLIVGRVIQGVGGGGMLPVTIAVAGSLTDDHQRVRTIGRIAAIDMVGWLVGPTYGALVLLLPASVEEPWRWIFWLNVPFVLGLLWPIASKTSEIGLLSSRRRADWLGAGLLATAIVALSLGVTSSGEVGAATTGLRAFGGTPNPLARHLPLLLAVGSIALVVFVVRQRLASDPMIPRRMLARPGGIAAIVANAAIGTGMMVAVVNIPVVVALTEPVDRVSPLTAVLLGVFTGSIVLAAFAGDRLLANISIIRRLLAGSICAAVGMALMYPLLEAQASQRLVPALVVAGLGIGCLLSPLTNAGLAGIDRAVAGTSVSLILLARFLGMTVGVSTLTAIGVRRLQTLTERLEPIVQAPGETTAAWLARQQMFVTDQAIPLAVQVVQETFLIGAVVVILALVPMLRMPRSDGPEGGDRVPE